MQYSFIACFLLTVITTYTLDQLPQDIFNIFMHQAVSLKDTQTIFSVVAANKKLLAQSMAWCKHECDTHIIEQLLHKACNNEPWTVCFVLCNPHITSAMVGKAINHATPDKSQQLLSIKFPHALQDGPLEKLQIEHRTEIASFIRNGFIIKTVYDEYNRSMPPLIYFCNCVQSSKKTNAFFPFDGDDIHKSPESFTLDLKIIQTLLKQNADPYSETIVYYTGNMKNVGLGYTPYSIVRCPILIAILPQTEKESLTKLLDSYAQKPKKEN